SGVKNEGQSHLWILPPDNGRAPIIFRYSRQPYLVREPGTSARGAPVAKPDPDRAEATWSKRKRRSSWVAPRNVVRGARRDGSSRRLTPWRKPPASSRSLMPWKEPLAS